MVALVITAGYFHTLAFPYHFDDFSSIRDNPVLDHPGDLRGIWEFRPSRFIVHLSLALNIALTGRSPAGLRLINLLIHLGASLVVGAIARELARQIAVGGAARADATRARGAPASEAAHPAPAVADAIGLLAALLFAAHPLATQAVTYLIQRTTSLAALFELASVALYLRARTRHGAGAWIGSWVCAILAALTKEMSVALPVAIAMIEWSLRRAGAGAVSWKGLIPYLAVFPIVAWTAQLPSTELGAAPIGFRESSEIGRLDYLLTQAIAIPRYLGLWLWPAGQTLDPDLAVRHRIGLDVLLGIGVLAVVSAGAFVVRRRQPLVTIGWAWFLICLLPESSVFPISDVMVEHRAYVPMAGLCWGAAVLLAGFAGMRRERWRLPMLIVLVLALATHARNRVWRDETTLWSDVTRKAPSKARGYNNLAMALDAEGRAAAAESTYRRAIEVESDYVYARVNLGRLYGLQGRTREALAVLEQAQRIEPDRVDVLTNLGTAWWALGDTTRAAAWFRRALEVEPGAPVPAANLARMRGLAP